MDTIAPIIETALQEDSISDPTSHEIASIETTFDKLNFVLNPEQIQVLRKIRANLELHRETTQIFRSEVEMLFSVLNDTKFPTPDAKYWQAVREQDVHFSNLVTLNYEFETEVIKIKNLHDMIRKNIIKQKRVERDMLNLEDSLEEEEAEIKYSMLQNKIDTLQVEIQKAEYFQDERKRVASNRWREVVTWEKICADLRPQMKYGILSYEHHQPESYGIRMERQERIMINSGAKGSPSEAINISSQNSMIKSLLKNGTLKLNPLEGELPIDKAVKAVMDMIDSGKNYLSNPNPPQTPQEKTPSRFINEEIDSYLTISNNPQIPV